MNRILAIILLIFNGISACFGGWMLLSDPSGEKLQMPLEMLQHSPFSDYFWPGLILFGILGIGNLIAAGGVIRRVKNYPYWVIFIGAALVIWICTQILMIQSFHWLQALYGGTGVALLVLGYREKKREY